MVSKKEMRMLQTMHSLIKEEAPISKIEVILRTSVSITYYDKLKPFLVHLYKDIAYDTKTHNWILLQEGENQE